MRRTAPLLLAVLAACQGRIEVPNPFTIGGPGGPCSDPGHVTLRRLNRVEYNNSMRDLLGDNTGPGNNFPADPSASFDNNGDVLAMSPLLLELYEATAAKVVDSALLPPAPPISHSFLAKDLAVAMCPGGTEPPGTHFSRPAWATKTIPKLTARRPSSEGMWLAAFDTG